MHIITCAFCLLLVLLIEGREGKVFPTYCPYKVLKFLSYPGLDRILVMFLIATVKILAFLGKANRVHVAVYGFFSVYGVQLN